MFPLGFFAGALIFGATASSFFNAMNADDERRRRNRILLEERMIAEQRAQQEAQMRRNAIGRFLATGSTAYDEIEMDLTNTLRNYELQYRMNKKKSNLFNDFSSGFVNGLNMYNRLNGIYDGRFKNQKN